MELTNKYAEKLNELIAEAECDYNKAREEQSYCEKAITDIYHYIEFEVLSSSEILDVNKKLKMLLQRRRKAKDTIKNIISLNSFIKMDWNKVQYMQTKRDSIYTYRTDIIEKDGIIK